MCDDSWDHTEARVVCRQLGMRGGVAHQGTSVEDGTGLIWLDNVYCTGSESRLLDCPATSIEDHNCDLLKDLLLL